MSQAQSPKAASKKDRHDAKFQRILDAALDVFVEKGFHNAKVGEVARAAGVADGTIYLYFENKEDLLASLFDVSTEALAKQLHQALSGMDSSYLKIGHLIDFHVELAQSQSRLLALMRYEVHVAYTRWGRRERAETNPYLAQWERVLNEGVADKTLKTHLSGAVLAHMLYGALDHACNAWAAQNQPQSLLNDIRTSLRSMLLRA